MDFMKKLFALVLLTATLIIGSVPVLATADVTGRVQLVTKPRSIPERLSDIFLGNSSRLPTAKKPKNIRVASSYDENKSRIRLDEVGEFSSTDKQYFFYMPVPSVMQVFSNKPQKSVKRRGLIEVAFKTLSELGNDNSEEDDDDNDDDDDEGGSIVKVIKKSKLKKINKRNKKRSGSESVGEAISIVRLVATRRGNKGTIKGSFASEKNRALGRFNLRFNYQQ
jgi:hypothetical protein